jgi:NADH-quinone oxidoreductase subunit M
MITVLLIIVPVLTGFISFFVKDEKSVKTLAVFSAVATLVISLISLFQNTSSVTYDASWLPMMGSRFTVSLDGMGKMLTLLTAVSFPVIFASTYNNHYKSPNAFYGFMLLTQGWFNGSFLCYGFIAFLLFLGTCPYSCLFPLF